MKLRKRISDDLKGRIKSILPEVIETVWDNDALLVMVEAITFKPLGGFSGNWKELSSFDGVLRVELRSDRIDDLAAEALIANFLKSPPFLKLPDDAKADEHHLKARLKLTEWRDSIRDNMVVGALRLQVNGTICQFTAPISRPDVVAKHEVSDE